MIIKVLTYVNLQLSKLKSKSTFLYGFQRILYQVNNRQMKQSGKQMINSNIRQRQIDDYGKSMISGALACCFTHLLIFPFQTTSYKIVINTNLVPNIFEHVRKQSLFAKHKIGWTPTFIGYSLYGSIKFGSYELLKQTYKNLIGQNNANQYNKIGWSIFSGLAQLIACTFLYPWLEIKRIMQLSRTNTFYPSTCIDAFKHFKGDSNMGYVLGRLIVLWLRQIPSTIIKFTAFESLIEMCYNRLMKKSKHIDDKRLQLGITFGSGFVAGVIPTLLSHPQDILVSKVYREPFNHRSFAQRVKTAYSEIGFLGLWKGVGRKANIQGTLFALQWLIYDGCKMALNVQKGKEVF